MIWEALLQLKPIAHDENFFDLGGHSLLLMTLHQYLVDLVEYDFALMLLLQHTTIASQASYFEHRNNNVDTRLKKESKRSKHSLLAKRQMKSQLKEKDYRYE